MSTWRNYHWEGKGEGKEHVVPATVPAPVGAITLLGKMGQLYPYPGAGGDEWSCPHAALAGQLRGCELMSWEGESSRDLDYLKFKEFVF